MLKIHAGSLLLCAGLGWSLAVMAQDPAADTATDPAAAPAEEAPAEPAPAADAAPAEPAAGETAPAEESSAAEAAPSADAGAAPAAAAEAAPADAPVADSASERTPWKLYAGIDQQAAKLILSDPALAARFGGAQSLTADMLRLRAGMRVFDWIGLELQLGAGSGDGNAAREFKIGSYYGLFAVPTGVLFDVVEFSGMVGYTQMKAEHAGQSETLSGNAYGASLEVPLRLLSESMPDVRIGLGETVLNATNRHRTAGLRFGVRYDFEW